MKYICIADKDFLEFIESRLKDVQDREVILSKINQAYNDGYEEGRANGFSDGYELGYVNGSEDTETRIQEDCGVL